ncbi:MAG: hypothetical protein V4640_14400 [Verrucomicrobiota bacterium]
MKYRSKATLATTLLLTATLSTALAGTDEEQDIAVPSASAVSPWTFEGSMYGWFTGLDGDIGVGGFNVGVDESFFDIVDDLNMAAMLRFEARNGKWGAIVDGFYVDLGTSGTPPGSLYNNADVDLKQFIGELSVAYRVYEGPSGFVDIYAGVRYNSFSIDLSGVLDQAGIQTVSNSASARVIEQTEARADAIAQPVIADYQTAAQAERDAIEAELAADIQAEVDDKVKEDIKKRLIEIQRGTGLDGRRLDLDRFTRNIKEVRVELVAAAAELEVAQLRATVDAAAQADIAKAEARLEKAEKDLATAIDGELDSLPTNKSADQDWLDPIIGVRAQWNINDRWFIAGKSDIGGFHVGSDLAWTLQATVGYNFTQNVSAELGYRYLHTDYSDSSLDYDVAQAGLYTSLNIKF